jgi:light-regulated signal transduction histidine kinase (bacteriophytochrome)
MTSEPRTEPFIAVLQNGALSPAFGNATLHNCEREQIHLAGSIQPHGALLVLRESDFAVLQASENIGSWLSHAHHACLGRVLGDLSVDLANAVRSMLVRLVDCVPQALRCNLTPARTIDLLVHRPPSGGLIVELEDAGAPTALEEPVISALRAIVSSASLQALSDETVWVLRELTGYDRVMVYRFDEEGHGSVLAEHCRPDLEAFLGNRYPATDIPQMARKLYERMRVRVLVDMQYTPVPILPRHAPDSGLEPDMSYCVLRSSSPIHVQYLKNMGVSATLVISLVVSGRLWGLISCHHYSPRAVSFEERSVCEFLAEAVSTRIAALESFVQSQVELSVRRIEQRIIDSITREGDWRTALFDGSNSLLTPLGAAGVALLFEGQCLTVGYVPSTPKLREIGLFLDEQAEAGLSLSPAFATSALSIDAPRFVSIADIASGLLAVTVSSSPTEYMVWFRPEQVQTVVWAGNPADAVMVGSDPTQLSPRRSFAQWHQRVEGTSAAWSPAELMAARLIGETVTDVVLQFRSVRTLIAQDQLAQVTRQVRESDQPVLIADESGHLLVVNDAFAALLPDDHGPVASFRDLAALFHEPRGIDHRLDDLRRHHRNWRGEVLMRRAAEGDCALLVRADPVFSAPGRVLGFVLLFTDLTERKEAEQARRSFQQTIAAGQQEAQRSLHSNAGHAAQSLLTSVLENAQLAAFEITDGVDTAGMARRLESVRVSVQRASDMLERLLRYSDQR